MFKKLVGDEYYESVVLGTTFWDTLTNIKRGEDREAELKREDALWAELIRRGSKIRRLGFNDRGRYLQPFVKNAVSPTGTDLDVLLEICENHKSRALCAQVEMDRGLNSEQTSAVMELNEWRERARHHREQMEKYRAEMREELASNGLRLRQELEQRCLRLDQAYEEQARAFALDKERLRESRRRVRALMDERSGRAQNATPAPEPDEQRRLREQIETSRRDHDTEAQQLTNSVKKECAFYQDFRKSSGIVRCKPVCKHCGREVNPGEKFFHCCYCTPLRHNYHRCHGCGNRCGRGHVKMLELQVAAR